MAAPSGGGDRSKTPRYRSRSCSSPTRTHLRLGAGVRVRSSRAIRTFIPVMRKSRGVGDHLRSDRRAMWCTPLRVARCHRCAVVPPTLPAYLGSMSGPASVAPRTYDCVVANEAPTAVYLDDADSTLYYLAFDFLLARAPVHGPIRDGVAVIGTWTVVDRMTSDEGADAYRESFGPSCCARWSVRHGSPRLTWNGRRQTNSSKKADRPSRPDWTADGLQRS